MGKNSLSEADLFKIQQRLQVNDPMMKTRLDKAFSIPKTKTVKSSPGKDHIEWVLKGLKLNYLKEFKFYAQRKFRFDFCIQEYKLAIEYEGIFSDISRHTSTTGYVRDVRKYNIAAIEGWRVLRYTAVNYKEIGSDLQSILKQKP